MHFMQCAHNCTTSYTFTNDRHTHTSQTMSYKKFFYKNGIVTCVCEGTHNTSFPGHLQ